MHSLLSWCVFTSQGDILTSVFLPQVLHRQRSNDCSSWLGDVSLWSGDRAGRLMDHTKVKLTELAPKSVCILFFLIILIYIPSFLMWWSNIWHQIKSTPAAVFTGLKVSICMKVFVNPESLKVILAVSVSTYFTCLYFLLVCRCWCYRAVLIFTASSAAGTEQMRWRWRGETERQTDVGLSRPWVGPWSIWTS